MICSACRKGVKCSVLESSPELRASGFAFATWTNAWQALDNLGVGDKIRKLHLHLQEYVEKERNTCRCGENVK
jgi:2-polyprenyl-6-methoxyphenol hydroxylase-like FAD-dependent oxidoreductase